MAQERELSGQGWSLSPYMLVRTTGFPFELIEALNCPRTVMLLDANAAMQDIEESFQAEFAALLTQLQRICAADDFREALFLSSPSVFAALRLPSPEAPMRSRERNFLRHLILYLQRLTTKCDTNSFFGPIWWGRIGQERKLLAFSAPNQFSIARRYVLWTHWAINTIAQVIAADPDMQEQLEVCVAHGLVLINQQAWLTDFYTTPPQAKEPIALSTVEFHLLAQCIESNRALYRADLVKDDPTRQAAFDRLREQGLLCATIEIPSGLAYPLRWLQASLHSFPDTVRNRWIPLLAALDETRVQYQNGDLAIRQQKRAYINMLFESTCKRASTRGEGTFYSDRSLLWEETERDWQHCDLGHPLLADITGDVLPVISILLDIECRRHRLRKAAVSAWFLKAFPGELEVPLPYMLAIAENDAELHQALQRVEDEVIGYGSELVQWLCQGNLACRHIAIPRDMIRARAESVDLLPCITNPDLMIGAHSVMAANNGEYYLVLGELHTLQDLTVHVSSSIMHPDKAGATAVSARQYARILPGVTIAEPVLEHTDKTKVILPHALLQIEFSGRAMDVVPDGEELLPSQGVLRAGDLRVRYAGNTLYLTAPGRDEIILTRTPVWSPYNRQSVLNIFTLPHCNRFEGQIYSYPSGCTHFPRVTVGRLIIHRETWWMAPQPAWKKVTGYSLDLWQKLRLWRTEQHMPEQVYVRFRDEPKPVFVDFRNPLLIDWFVRKAATANRPACVTECLPEAEHLWLQDSRGHYSCEFRMTMYLDGSHLKN